MRGTSVSIGTKTIEVEITLRIEISRPANLSTNEISTAIRDAMDRQWGRMESDLQDIFTDKFSDVIDERADMI